MVSYLQRIAMRLGGNFALAMFLWGPNGIWGPNPWLIAALFAYSFHPRGWYGP